MFRLYGTGTYIHSSDVQLGPMVSNYMTSVLVCSSDIG